MTSVQTTSNRSIIHRRTCVILRPRYVRISAVNTRRYICAPARRHKFRFIVSSGFRCGPSPSPLHPRLPLFPKQKGDDHSRKHKRREVKKNVEKNRDKWVNYYCLSAYELFEYILTSATSASLCQSVVKHISG